MQLLSDLLPCPFCGGEPIITDYKNIIECKKCYATSNMGTKEDVIKMWNRRTPATAPVHKTINEHTKQLPVHKLINEHKPKAGRKTILTRRLYYDIMQYHKSGSSIRQIIHYIDTFRGEKLSIGFVHKVIKMPPPLEQLEDQLTLEEQEYTA